MEICEPVYCCYNVINSHIFMRTWLYSHSETIHFTQQTSCCHMRIKCCHQHFVPHCRCNAPPLYASQTSGCLPPTATQHLSLATSWERPNYTNIGKGVRLRAAKCDTGQRNVWLLIKSRLVVAFPQLICIWQAHT